jgi:hypothetical protein
MLMILMNSIHVSSYSYPFVPQFFFPPQMGVLMNSKEEEWKIFQMHVKAPVGSSLSSPVVCLFPLLSRRVGSSLSRRVASRCPASPLHSLSLSPLSTLLI